MSQVYIRKNILVQSALIDWSSSSDVAV